MKNFSRFPFWPVWCLRLTGLGLLGLVHGQNPEASLGVVLGFVLSYLVYNIVTRLLGFEALNGAPISGPWPQILAFLVMLALGLVYGLTKSDQAMMFIPLTGALVSMSKRFYLAEMNKVSGPKLLPRPGFEQDPEVLAQARHASRKSPKQS